MIPREGVERCGRDGYASLGVDRVVIPREGVESARGHVHYFLYAQIVVIPREGVESLPLHEVVAEDTKGDPERGS